MSAEDQCWLCYHEAHAPGDQRIAARFCEECPHCQREREEDTALAEAWDARYGYSDQFPKENE
jgi:hypothetical protein